MNIFDKVFGIKVRKTTFDRSENVSRLIMEVDSNTIKVEGKEVKPKSRRVKRIRGNGHDQSSYIEAATGDSKAST